MDWRGVLFSSLTELLVVFGGGGVGWLFARRQNKAETAKTLAEARLTDANAERVRVESQLEKLFSEKVGQVFDALRGHSQAIERVENGLADVRHEVMTNTGTSLKDAVIRAEAESKAVNVALSASHADRKALHEDLSGLKVEVRRYADAALIEHRRMWEAIDRLDTR